MFVARLLSLLVALVLVGCGAGPRAPASERASGRRIGQPLAPVSPHGPATKGAVDECVAARRPRHLAQEALLRTEAEFDGCPGTERIVLLEDGTLLAGAAEGRADASHAGSPWFEEQGALRVVTLREEPLLRAILLVLPASGFDDVDPPSRYQLFVLRNGRLHRVLVLQPAAYGGVPLRFPGDGTLRYIEDGWAACERIGGEVGSRRVAVRQEVIFQWDPHTGRMWEAARRPTASRQRCDMLAACPFVYLLGEGAPVRVGEILRNLRGPRAHSLQSLPLPPLAGRGRWLRLRLAEEKPEATYLDEVYLEADGTRIPPQACTRGTSEPQYCEADRRFWTLGPGEVLELSFHLPPKVHRLALWARGYYVPRLRRGDAPRSR